MSFKKRQGSDAVCYTNPLDSPKNWNDNFFWVDSFACPASFPWHTSKTVSKDRFPKSSQYNAEHYATLVAHPTLFISIQILCLIGISRNNTFDADTYPRFLRENGEEMDLFSFIRTTDPTKVRIVERQRGEDEPKLLDATVGRTVPLLPVAPARAESELEASGAGIQFVSETAKVATEDVASLQPRQKRKRKTIVVVDAVEPSHPAKKLRDDHGTLGGPTVRGKSQSAIQRLLAGPVLNAEVRGEVVPTLPFVTSSMSATSKQTEVDSLIRSLAPVMITATTVTAMASAAPVVKKTVAKPSLFAIALSSAGGTDPALGGFSDLTGSDLLVGDVRTVVDPDSDLQKVYVPQWNVTNGSLLDDSRVCREMVDEFAPPKFFASVRGMEQDQLFAEFNVGSARQVTLGAEVRMRAEYNIREKIKLKSIVEEKDTLLKAKDTYIESLRAQLLVKEAEATEAIRLRAEASNFEAIEKSLRDKVNSLNEHNLVLEKERDALDVKSDNLVDRVHELETSSAGLHEKVATYEDLIDQLERFQDEKMEELLTHGMELALAKCMNSTKYMSALGAAMSRAVEKGMQEGLSAGITHGAEGRELSDVASYNSSTEADYHSALQRLQSINFSLITELKSNKDSSVDTIMNLLRLDDALAKRLGLTKSQPHVNQLMVPIHHSLDQRVIGASALSLSLEVSNSRVRKIKENIANHVSALRGVFVPLSEPLSVTALEGTEGTSGVAPGTTTALSTTFVSASTVPSLFIDDYEITGADNQATVDASTANEDSNPFPNMDDAELNVPE
ncbi:hypothetical protein Tco_1290100 [Tanacetum coccineum]